MVATEGKYERVPELLFEKSKPWSRPGRDQMYEKSPSEIFLIDSEENIVLTNLAKTPLSLHT